MIRATPQAASQACRTLLPLAPCGHAPVGLALRHYALATPPTMAIHCSCGIGRSKRGSQVTWLPAAVGRALDYGLHLMVSTGRLGLALTTAPVMTAPQCG